MVKKNKEDPRQLTFAEQLNKKAGSLNIDVQLKALLNSAMKSSPLSRKVIASHMSDLTGEEISEATLYSYTRNGNGEGEDIDNDSNKKRRGIPAQFIPAFCVVTDDQEILKFFCGLAGMYAAPGTELLRTKLRSIDKDMAKAKAEKRKIEMLLEMEGNT